MFDISEVAENQIGTLRLKHPLTGAFTGGEIDIAGSAHPARKQIEFDRARAMRSRLQKKGRLEMTDPQDDEDYQLDRLAGITTGWRGIAKDGQPLALNATTARALYEVSWIRKQVEEFLSDDTNFLACGSKPSSSESNTQSGLVAG